MCGCFCRIGRETALDCSMTHHENTFGSSSFIYVTEANSGEKFVQVWHAFQAAKSYRFDSTTQCAITRHNNMFFCNLDVPVTFPLQFTCIIFTFLLCNTFRDFIMYNSHVNLSAFAVVFVLATLTTNFFHTFLFRKIDHKIL